MNEKTDQELIREYARTGSEQAFAELVRRHIDLIYSVAVRLLVDRHWAEDAVQKTFTALARNARKLTDRTVLSGWLHRTTHNFAVMIIRTEERRRVREEKAATMLHDDSPHPSDKNWNQIGPHLDEAVSCLSEGDQDAIALRFFERKSGKQMADSLGITEEAAQKRVTRAVNRLRHLLMARGVTVPAAVIISSLGLNAVHAAPTALVGVMTAKAMADTALAGSASAGWFQPSDWLTSLKAKPLATAATALTVLSLGTGGYITGRAASEKHWQALAWQNAVMASPDSETAYAPWEDRTGPSPSTTEESAQRSSVQEVFAAAARHFRNLNDDPEAWSRGFLAMQQLRIENINEVLEILRSYEGEEGVFRSMAPLVMEKWALFDPRAALNHALANYEGSLRGLGLQNISRSWAKSDPAAAWDWYQQSTEAGEIPMNQGSWMWIPKFIMAEWVTHDPASAFQLFQTMPYADQGKAIFGIAEAATNPALRPAILREITNLPSETDQHRVARKVVSQWAKLEPENAAQWAAGLRFVNPSARLSVMSEVAEEWWPLDPHATAQWFLANVSGELFDQAADALRRATPPANPQP